jgi:hypothetical protein
MRPLKRQNENGIAGTINMSEIIELKNIGEKNYE